MIAIFSDSEASETLTDFEKYFCSRRSRAGLTSLFLSTEARTRSLWVFRGVSTLNRFSPENQISFTALLLRNLLNSLLHCSRRFFLFAAESSLTETPLNAFNCSSHLTIRRTDERGIPVSLDTSRSLPLVPVCPSWLTNMFDVLCRSCSFWTTCYRLTRFTSHFPELSQKSK